MQMCLGVRCRQSGDHRFDEETTRAWLLATAISLATSWVTEPFKTLLLVYALGCFKRIRVKQTIRLKQIGNQVIASNAIRLAPIANQPINKFQPPDKIVNSEWRLQFSRSRCAPFVIIIFVGNVRNKTKDAPPISSSLKLSPKFNAVLRLDCMVNRCWRYAHMNG